MSVVLKLSYRMDGVEDEVFGKYVIYYNPEIRKDGRFTLTVAEDIRDAKKFADSDEAINYWRQICPNLPPREWDGKPERPLTVYCCSIEDRDEENYDEE